jgi:hypothetical protein
MSVLHSSPEAAIYFPTANRNYKEVFLMKLLMDNPTQQSTPLPAIGDSLSSLAVCKSHWEDSPYFDGWKEYARNPYHPINNSSGIIQMALVENQVYSIISYNHNNVCI